MNERLTRLLKNIHRIEDGILALLLFCMILLATSQIFLRNVFDSGIIWADPLLRIMVLWLGMLGALAATRENRHITIDVLTRFLSETARYASKSFTCLFSAGISALLSYHCLRYVIDEYEAKTKVITDIPAWPLELILPFAFMLIALRFSIHFVINLKATMKNLNNKDPIDRDK